MKPKVVYQAYGRQDIIDQVLFSVASLFSHYPAEVPFEVEIYTDKVEALSGFFGNEPLIKLIPITAEQIKAWRGQIDFVHRVKLKVLELASASATGPVVYLDGDTYFTRRPDELFAQINNESSLMHVRETALGEAKDILNKKIAKFVKGRSFKLPSGDLRIPPTTEMWNAGVIGLSKKNTGLFPKMVEMTDVLYAEYQKHVMEQLAVSYFVKEAGRILPADGIIIHYWPNKENFDKAIAGYLTSNKSFAAARAHMATFPWPPAPTPKKKKWWFL